MNLCSQMGPTCDYSGIMGCTTFRAFVPPGGGGCGGGSPWTGQPACVSECERQVAYTGSCVDLIAAAMTCWPLVCSTGHAVFTKQAPDCATLNAAAQDCVNTCAF
jgi:hypothetical protein